GFQPPKALQHPFFQALFIRIFGSVLTGVLLALAFPGFSNSTLVYTAFVPLLFAIQTVSVKRAAWLGMLSGTVFFLISLFWLHNLTGMVEGAALRISALLGYGVLALYCALYFVPFSLIAALGGRRWVGSNLRKNVRYMVALTAVWVGSEYLRSVLFTGFPWNSLGVSQYANAAVIQIAEWGGVYLVSACIVWMNVAIFITLRQYTHGIRLSKYRPHMELMIGLLPIALSIMQGMNTLFNKTGAGQGINVALVQPNIKQSAKWDDAKDQEIRVRLEELTEGVVRLADLDLVIWPETAIPDFIRSSPVSYDLVTRLTAKGTPLLVGTMDFTISDTGVQYFNSSILFDTNGNEIGKYDKQHLVPFGEYVPLPGLMRKFTPIEVDFGSGAGSTLLPIKGEDSFSVLICFEDTVAPLAVNAVRAGARWLVNQTNDAWFDPSFASEQHVAHAVFRCIENRVPMARCSNTGVTCFIDANGIVNRGVDVRTAGFSAGVIHPRSAAAELTFYTRYGDLFAWGCLLICATVFYALCKPLQPAGGNMP
ncbi:MAG TPA: apolipoprotein N-acyltransferase, partial [Pontiella sp.]|nr:apolipoprotein N-acyltransferase [Pontiella sp.]